MLGAWCVPTDRTGSQAGAFANRRGVFWAGFMDEVTEGPEDEMLLADLVRRFRRATGS